jgi:hypothetical protein
MSALPYPRVADEFAAALPGRCATPGCGADVPPWWQSYCLDCYTAKSAMCTACGKYRTLHPTGLCFSHRRSAA